MFTIFRNIMLNNGAISVVTNEVLKKAHKEMDHYAKTGNEYCPRDMVFCTTYAIFTELCLNKKYGSRRFSPTILYSLDIFGEVYEKNRKKFVSFSLDYENDSAKRVTKM